MQTAKELVLLCFNSKGQGVLCTFCNKCCLYLRASSVLFTAHWFLIPCAEVERCRQSRDCVALFQQKKQGFLCNFCQKCYLYLRASSVLFTAHWFLTLCRSRARQTVKELCCFVLIKGIGLFVCFLLEELLISACIICTFYWTLVFETLCRSRARQTI